MPFEKNPDELGQLWAKQGSKGPYLTGEINGVKVVCFAVNSDNPKAPTWRVLKSKPKDAMAGGFTRQSETQIDADDVGF